MSFYTELPDTSCPVTYYEMLVPIPASPQQPGLSRLPTHTAGPVFTLHIFTATSLQHPSPQRPWVLAIIWLCSHLFCTGQTEFSLETWRGKGEKWGGADEEGRRRERESEGEGRVKEMSVASVPSMFTFFLLPLKNPARNKFFIFGKTKESADLRHNMC